MADWRDNDWKMTSDTILKHGMKDWPDKDRKMMLHSNFKLSFFNRP